MRKNSNIGDQVFWQDLVVNVFMGINSEWLKIMSLIIKKRLNMTNVHQLILLSTIPIILCISFSCVTSYLDPLNACLHHYKNYHIYWSHYFLSLLLIKFFEILMQALNPKDTYVLTSSKVCYSQLCNNKKSLFLYISYNFIMDYFIKYIFISSSK